MQFNKNTLFLYISFITIVYTGQKLLYFYINVKNVTKSSAYGINYHTFKVICDCMQFFLKLDLNLFVSYTGKTSWSVFPFHREWQPNYYAY